MITIIYGRLLNLKRNWLPYAFMIALPLVLMFVFGSVMGNEDSGIMLPIADLDETEQSAILVEELENLGAYNIKLMDEEGLRQMVMENGPRSADYSPRL